MQDESFENMPDASGSTEILPQEPLAEVEVEPTPWPFWPTIGFSAAIVATYIAASIPLGVVGFIWFNFTHPEMSTDQISEALLANGFFLTVTTFIMAVPVIGLSVLFASLRKNITIKEYFCLKRPTARQLYFWFLATVAMIVIFDTSSSLTGRDIVPQWMMDIHETSVFLPLLWAAIIIGAPITEEVFFRGFLFNGILHSKLGAVGAVVITSAIWASIHTQYDIINISHIFIGGLMIGYARVKTGSLYVPIAMHMLMNIVSTAELTIKLAWGQ